MRSLQQPQKKYAPAAMAKPSLNCARKSVRLPASSSPSSSYTCLGEIRSQPGTYTGAISCTYRLTDLQSAVSKQVCQRQFCSTSTRLTIYICMHQSSHPLGMSPINLCCLLINLHVFSKHPSSRHLLEIHAGSHAIHHPNQANRWCSYLYTQMMSFSSTVVFMQ